MQGQPKIDFVVTWVDNRDDKWRRLKESYAKDSALNSAHRYRDMQTFHYWFRAVEKFAPWVNRVIVVTEGHLPSWLNVDHPKLRVVKHRDFIPEEYLPTFNSNVIELNLHRITDLSEQFVLFNDDVFLTQSVSPSDFFKHGKPRLLGIYRFLIPNQRFNHIELNNIMVMNRYFFDKKTLKSHPFKFFNFRYGKSNLVNAVLALKKGIPGYKDNHVAYPHLKSTFQTLWEMELERLQQVSLNKFRTIEDISHWLMGYWNIESNNFYPQSINFGKYLSIKDADKMKLLVTSKKYKTICVNDDFKSKDFEAEQSFLVLALDGLLSEKSTFEK